MTDADLDAIRARLAAATPGPWTLIAYEHGGGRLYVEEPRALVADLYHEGDRALIARAPADIAALLDEVERLRAGRQRLRSALLQQAAAMARRDTVADAHDLGLISRAAYLRARPTLERADAAAMDLHRAAMRALEDDSA